MRNKIVPIEPRAVTGGERNHFFGYYEKSPWNGNGKHMLGLEIDFYDRVPGVSDYATIGLIEPDKEYSWTPIDETNTWNWQQGAMLHWLPNDPDRSIIFNKRENGNLRSIIKDIASGESTVLPLPIYTVFRNGKEALTLDFSRFNDSTRAVCGYPGLHDTYYEEAHPEGSGISRMNLKTGEHCLILSYDQIAGFQSDSSMQDAKHWVNHLQINPDDSRFMFLHRWRRAEQKMWSSRLLTADMDGSRLCSLTDQRYVSHCDWLDGSHILSWSRNLDGLDMFYLYADCDSKVNVFDDELLTRDGHCSFSPDREWLLTDTVPDEDRMKALLLYHLNSKMRVDIGAFIEPDHIGGDTRCDLHPRWNRDGTEVCIDSVHEGSRQMYIFDVSQIVGGGGG